MNKLTSFFICLFLPILLRLTNTRLGDKLPRLVKRKLLMISAFALFRNINKPSDEVFKTVKKLFEVDKDPFILMALKLKSYTWKQFDKDGMVINNKVVHMEDIKYDTMSVEEMNNIADRLVDRTPRWLIYGSKDLIKHDINAVLDSIRMNHFNKTIIGI